MKSLKKRWKGWKKGEIIQKLGVFFSVGSFYVEKERKDEMRFWKGWNKANMAELSLKVK